MNTWANYKFHIHPLIKIGLFISVNILLFFQFPDFPYLARLIIISVDILMILLLRVNFSELKIYTKAMILNFLGSFVLLAVFRLDLKTALLFSYDYILTILSMFLTALVYWKCTPNQETYMIFRKLRVPKAISLGIMIAFGFIPSFIKEYQKTMVYQKSRGYKFSLWNLDPILIPIILNILQTSINLSLSIESRGFKL